VTSIIVRGRHAIEKIVDTIAEVWINHDCYDMCRFCHSSSL